MPQYNIRLILKNDNSQIANVIKQVLRDFNVPEKGTALSDASLNSLYEFYQKPRACYLVIENNTKILGGAGIGQLDNFDGNVCELQKMYFLPEVRGLGLGRKMIETCLQKAKDFLYDGCYLETMEYMQAAQKLYVKNGFTYLKSSLGDTGHYSCPVHMFKNM